MRTKLILTLFSFGLGTAQAQPLFDVGLKGGVNSNDLTLGEGGLSKNVLGWNAGAFARLQAPALPGLQGEVLLSSAGSELDLEGDLGEIQFTYLQVPVFLVFRMGPLELHAGGYYGRPLSSSLHDLTDGDVPLFEEAPAEEDRGLLAGVGVHLGRVYAGARYLYGLEDIGGLDDLGEVHNRQAQVYLGLGLFK